MPNRQTKTDTATGQLSQRLEAALLRDALGHDQQHQQQNATATATVTATTGSSKLRSCYQTFLFCRDQNSSCLRSVSIVISLRLLPFARGSRVVSWHIARSCRSEHITAACLAVLRPCRKRGWRNKKKKKRIDEFVRRDKGKIGEI